MLLIKYINSSKKTNNNSDKSDKQHRDITNCNYIADMTPPSSNYYRNDVFYYDKKRKKKSFITYYITSHNAHVIYTC